MKRLPIAAGTFYPSDAELLIKEIEWCFKHPLGPGELPIANPDTLKGVVGYVVPHAGYRYSGPIAAHAYLALSKRGTPRVVIVIGPNHSGIGSPVATMIEGSWVTPLGELEVDRAIAMRLLKSSSYLDADPKAFTYEHSIEVQLPFLQYVYRDRVPRIVPVAMGLQHIDVVKDLCEALYSVLIDTEGLVILATSDWTHYEPYEIATSKDRKALEFVEALDYVGLMRYSEEVNLTACGLGAVAVLMCVARKASVERGRLLAYATSGDVTGDRSSVVGYAAVEMAKA